MNNRNGLYGSKFSRYVASNRGELTFVVALFAAVGLTKSCSHAQKEAENTHMVEIRTNRLELMAGERYAPYQAPNDFDYSFMDWASTTNRAY